MQRRRMEATNKRIFGYDFARGLAIIGMVFVNFKMVIAVKSDAFLYNVIEILSGKAAALFVILAGVSISLMYQSAHRKNSAIKIRQVKKRLLKRALFLFVIGLSFYAIWPADILHYYGLYLTIGVLFLSVANRWLLITSGLIIIGYPLSMFFFNYETGWNWDTLEYIDFFTVNGFFRNLFFNGFHPVFPWIAFLLIGIWVGRINFNNITIRKKISRYSLIAFVLFKGLSLFIVGFLTQTSPNEAQEIAIIFGTMPMPSFFFYMVTASSLAIFIISMSIYICTNLSHLLIVKQLISTGQLALSNYIFHVLIGLFSLELFFGKLEQAYSIGFMFTYAVIYCVLLLVFSHLWRKKYTYGPLEYLMRKLIG